MELPKELFEQISRYSEAGNALLETGSASEAYIQFETAADLLPEPRESWEAYAWLFASMGECRFIEGNFQEAYDCFLAAYNSTVPDANPYVLLRLGECCTEIKNNNSTEFLFRAFLLAGEDIFKAENDKYFRSIQPLIDNGAKAKEDPAENTQQPASKRMSHEDAERYNKAFDIASEYYEKRDWNNYFDAMVAAWNSIPEPRYEYAESFEFFICFIPNTLQYCDPKLLMKWIPALQSAGVDRPDIGEREYYIGCIYYENGMLEDAFEMFRIADKKSRGRALMDNKYKKVYREWKKSHKKTAL